MAGKCKVITVNNINAMFLSCINDSFLKTLKKIYFYKIFLFFVTHFGLYCKVCNIMLSIFYFLSGKNNHGFYHRHGIFTTDMVFLKLTSFVKILSIYA